MMQSAPFTYRRLIIWIGRLVLGVIFLYAGVAKRTARKPWRAVWHNADRRGRGGEGRGKKLLHARWTSKARAHWQSRRQGVMPSFFA